MKKNKGNVLVISQIIPPEYSGAGVASIRLANRFYNCGNLFGIITATKKEFIVEGYSLKGFENELSLLETKIYRFKFIDYQSSAFPIIKLIFNLNLAFFQFFWFLIRKRGGFTNLYVSSCTVFTFIPVIISKVLGKRVIIETTLAGQDDCSTNFNKGLSFLKFIRRLHFLVADYIVDVSPALHKSSLATPIAKKARLIPFGVETSRFYRLNDNDKSDLKSKLLPFVGNRKVVLFVGGISNRKGFDIFLKVFEMIIEKSLIDRFVFVVIGSRNYNADERNNFKLLKDLNKNLPESNKIYFSDPIGNVNQYMQVSDVFLFPTYAEGLPIVVLEAMTCGCIPILSNVEGISDYLVDEKSGYIIDSYNAIDYFKLFENLAFWEETQWNNLSNYTSSRARRFFSAEITFKERMRLFK